jgi:hypothetical protein
MSEKVQDDRAAAADHGRPLVTAGLAALTIASVAVAIAFGRMSPLWGWIATAAGLVCGAEAVRRSGPLLDRFSSAFPRLDTALRAAAPWALLGALLLWALWPLPIGEMPVNQDHAHHFLATDILVDDFIREFRLFGWTDRVSGGLPFGDVYPTLVYLITGAANLLTFGLIPLEVSYAWGIVAVWALGIVAVGLWGRRLAAEAKLRFLAAAPLVAGAAYLLDVGGDREGGWVYHMFHAVWPQQIATATLFLGLLGLFWFVERPTTRRLGLVATTIGVAVWFHPMVAVNLAILTPLVVLVLALDPRDDARPAVVWVGVTLFAGAVIAMFWFSHMLSAAEVMRSNIAYWELLGEMGAMLWRGSLFDNAHAVVGVLALAGVATAIFRGGRQGLFAVLAFTVLLVFGGMNLLAEFDVGLSEHNRLFMYRRVAITAKPLYFAFAGVGACAVVQAVLSGVRSIDRERTRWITVAMLVASAPLVWALGASLPSLVRGPTARILTADGMGIAEDLEALEKLLRDDASDGVRRAVYWTQGGQQGDYGLLAIANADYGYLPTRRPPAQAFTELNEGRSLKEMAFAGADLLIARTPQKRSGLELIEELETLSVYRIVDPKPSKYPVKLTGPGKVEVVEWAPHRQVLKLSGVKKKSRLIIGRPHYDEWTAELDGEPVKLGPHRRSRGYTYTEVTKLHDGTIVLEYSHSTTEVFAFWLGLLVLLGCGVLVFVDRPLPTWPTGEVGRRRLAIAAVGTTAVIVTTGLVVLAWLGDRGIEEEWAKKNQKVLAALHHRAPAFDYHPRPDCIRPYTRDAHDRCVESELYPRLGLGERRKKTTVPTCLRFGVPEDGEATLAWTLPAKTTKVAGRLHGNRVANRLDITIGSGKKRKEIQPNGRRFALGRLPDERLVLKLKNPVGRTADLCLELVALGRK